MRTLLCMLVVLGALAGPVGGAYTFTAASSQYLSTGTTLSAHPITFACFANPSGGATVQTLMSFGSNASITPFVIMRLRGDAGSVTEATVRDDVATSGTATGPTFSTGVWQHFCAVFASTSSRTMYVNAASGTTETTAVGAMTLNLTGVAATIRATPLQFANAVIAEVGIWSAALTAREIASLSAGVSPIHVRPQSLVAYYPLINGLNNRVARVTLTNNNGATVSRHPRVYAFEPAPEPLLWALCCTKLIAIPWQRRKLPC